MTPDFEKAALKATETLIKYRVAFAPVDPMPILKSYPGVRLVSFTEFANDNGIERKNIISAFPEENRDVVTSIDTGGEKPHYLVVYNLRLPHYIIQRAMARELGHIVLGHNGTRPEDVRDKEARCFAYNLLCPRQLISALSNAGIKLTIETIGNITGCYGNYISEMGFIPGAHIPAELNRIVRDQFEQYITDILDCKTILTNGEGTSLANFGTYMDNYEE